MKSIAAFLTFVFCSFISVQLNAQSSNKGDTAAHPNFGKNLFIDVHQFQPGTVKYEDVTAAHQKDLAVQQKFSVNFIKFWIDEEKGIVYCLSSTADSSSIRKAHAAAHGLLPALIYPVTQGEAAEYLFLDIHYLGAGKVTAKDVAAAHKKDLAVQDRHGVNFINYWVDEKQGIVMCLSQAKDSSSVIETHREAHGLLPASIMKVKQGQ